MSVCEHNMCRSASVRTVSVIVILLRTKLVIRIIQNLLLGIGFHDISCFNASPLRSGGYPDDLTMGYIKLGCGLRVTRTLAVVNPCAVRVYFCRLKNFEVNPLKEMPPCLLEAPCIFLFRCAALKQIRVERPMRMYLLLSHQARVCRASRIQSYGIEFHCLPCFQQNNRNISL